MDQEQSDHVPSSLNEILRPKSIAIIGASNDSKKRGFQAIRRLQSDSFLGNIYPVNPNHSEIAGLPCYRSITDIQLPVDLALVCTPADTLPTIIEQCGISNVKGAAVLAGGFSEAGKDGRILEQSMLAIAKKYGVRLIGPNTSGFFNRHINCNLVGFDQVAKGNIGILSQSGNMALSLVTEGASNRHIGFSTYVGVGNEADISFDEYLDYFLQDHETKVIVAYVEGLKQGYQFLQAAKRTTQSKPVILFKSGRTDKGKASAKSHTGALAGNYKVSRDVMKQAGITVVSRFDMILPMAEVLSTLPPPKSRKVAVLADGGGHATIAADALSDLGLNIPELSHDAQDALRAFLPVQAAVRNPVDVAGATDADPTKFVDCAKAILSDPNIDGLIVVGLFGGYHLRFDGKLKEAENETAIKLSELMKQSGKPIIVQSVYSLIQSVSLQVLRQQGIPTYTSVETAVHCYAALAEFGRSKSKSSKQEDDGDQTSTTSDASHINESSKAKAITKLAIDQRRTSLFEHEAKSLLKEYGVDISDSFLATTSNDLEGIARAFNDTPVAMKVVSKDILHKSDAGGVQLNVIGLQAIHAAWENIFKNAQDYKEEAEIAGVLVEPMADAGVEIIIGLMNDPQFGRVIMFGLGGIFVEVLKDVAFRSLPISESEASAMIEQVKGTSILNGARGNPPVDKLALIQLITSVSRLFLSHPEISEIDLNPIIAHENGITVADARMILGTSTNL